MRRKKYRIIIQSIIICAVCLSSLVAVASFYIRYLNENIIAEITTSLKEVSNKNAKIIETKMDSNLKLLKSFATYMETDHLLDVQGLVNQLTPVSDNKGFKRMGIATPDGNCYTTDGFQTNITQREYFQRAMRGEANISDVMNDLLTDKGKINAYAVPMYQKDTVAAVLFMVEGTQDVSKDLLVTSFEGKGYSLICDKNANVILRSSKDESTYQNLNELSFDKDVSVIEDTSGFGSYEDETGSHYMAYTELGINDWLLVSNVPSSVVSAQISSFSQMAVFTWFIIILVFMVLLIYIYLSWHRNNRNMQEVLFKDALTGYDNFNKFKMDVEGILEEKNGYEKGALIELDIEDFKMFNKIHGYEVGDELLKNIMRCINLYCGTDERCAHISDDRFVLYWKEQSEEVITKRINQMYSNTIMIFESEGKRVGVKFHLCFGVYIMEGNDDILMKSLDKAIYAKNHIKNNYDTYIAFYNDKMYQQGLKEKEMLSRVENAINDGEFIVYLQPKVDVNTMEIISAEALVRWNDPVCGIIPPIEFIPLFERSGDLQRIDMFVFSKVCKTLKRWQKEHKKMIKISVNISKSYMFANEFAKRLADIVEANKISTKYIELEITESTMLENLEDLLTVIDELKGYGFKISMDDFGSGYSSLNMLKDVPIDVIKIDQVFFQNTVENRLKSNIIVEGLCQLIDMLNIEVVAEGIETDEQLRFLQRIKCHVAQGFYFYRPMPISQLEAILNQVDQV